MKSPENFPTLLAFSTRSATSMNGVWDLPEGGDVNFSHKLVADLATLLRKSPDASVIQTSCRLRPGCTERFELSANWSADEQIPIEGRILNLELQI